MAMATTIGALPEQNIALSCAKRSSLRQWARRSSGTTFSFMAPRPVCFGKLYFRTRMRSRQRCSPSAPISSASSPADRRRDFGHYGDRIGRKATLIATLLCMGLATFAIAFVPTYSSIGIWGAVLLTVLRMIQGIGVGGEWGGSVLLAMEWSRTKGQRGLWRPGRSSACPAAIAGEPRHPCLSAWATGDDFLVWAGASVRAVDRPGRRRSVDPPRHPRDAGVPAAPGHQEGREAPILEVIKKQPMQIVWSALLRLSEQAPFYVSPPSSSPMRRHPAHVAELHPDCGAGGGCVSFFTIPIAGHLSDKIGRKKMYLIGVVTMGIFGFVYSACGYGSARLVFIAIVLSLIPHDMQYGPQAALIAEAFTRDCAIAAPRSAISWRRSSPAVRRH